MLLKNIPEEASMNLADDLLTACEKAGMLPPAIKATHGFTADEYGLENEWEED